MFHRSGGNLDFFRCQYWSSLNSRYHKNRKKTEITYNRTLSRVLHINNNIHISTTTTYQIITRLYTYFKDKQSWSSQLSIARDLVAALWISASNCKQTLGLSELHSLFCYKCGPALWLVWSSNYLIDLLQHSNWTFLNIVND
jgi:hypothetical protein